MAVNISFLIVITLLALVEWGLVNPFKNIGFYCKDPKFNYINSGETVTVNLLLTVSFILPYFVFLTVERFTRTNSEGKSAKHLWLEKTHFWYLKYLHGLCFTFLITDLAKFLVGEPRPHFFQTCMPEENLNCTIGDYFYHYKCTNHAASRKIIADSFKSFPSGHASFSFYSAVFFLVYFTRQIRTNSHLMLNVLQFFCIFWALLCSLTRITDYRHHWWDVLFGSILGTTVASYFIWYRPKYKEKKEDKEYSSSSEKNKNLKFNLILNSNS